jgi:hypothetical protein
MGERWMGAGFYVQQNRLAHVQKLLQQPALQAANFAMIAHSPAARDLHTQ